MSVPPRNSLLDDKVALVTLKYSRANLKALFNTMNNRNTTVFQSKIVSSFNSSHEKEQLLCILLSYIYFMANMGGFGLAIKVVCVNNSHCTCPYKN